MIATDVSVFAVSYVCLGEAAGHMESRGMGLILTDILYGHLYGLGKGKFGH